MFGPEKFESLLKSKDTQCGYTTIVGHFTVVCLVAKPLI